MLTRRKVCRNYLSWQLIGFIKVIELDLMIVGYLNGKKKVGNTEEQSSRITTNNIEKLRNLVPKDFWVKKELRKHRYVYLLGNKKEKKIAMKGLKYPALPYPKVKDIQDVEILKIEVK